MSFDHIAQMPLVQALGWTLLHFLWQGTLIAAVVYLLLSLVNGQSANRRYAILMFAFLVMALAPLITLNSSYRSSRLSDSSAPLNASSPTPSNRPFHASSKMGSLTEGRGARSEPGFDSTVAEPATGLNFDSSANDPTGGQNQRNSSRNVDNIQMEADATVGTGIFSPKPVILAVAACCWITGVMLLSVRFMFGCIYLGRQVTGAQITTDATLLGWFKAQCHRQGISSRTRLMESRKILVPMTIGWLKPIVVVPTSAITGLSEDELKAIIIHELAHIRRWDYLVNLFQTVFEIVMFFHPAVWWLSKQIRAERENCCDDVAVSLSGNPKTYLNALTEIARNSTSGEVNLVPSATGGDLLFRVRRVLSRLNATEYQNDSGKGESNRSGNRFAANPSSQSIGGVLSLLLVVVLICGICVAINLLSDSSRAYASNASIVTEDSDPDFVTPPPVVSDSESKSTQFENTESGGAINSTSESYIDSDDLIVLGLNVSRFPANTALKNIPDLFVESDTKTGQYVWSGKGWSIRVEKDIWIVLRADLNRFYVHDQSQTRSVHYGPIPGDPFERLKLTELMIHSINSTNHLQQTHFQTRTKRMLSSTHLSLIRHGLEIVAKIERLSYQDTVDIHDLVEKVATRNQQGSESKSLKQLLAKARANVSRMINEYAEIQAVVKKEDCASSRAATKFELAKLSWGKELNGLTMAFAPWDGSSTEFRTSERISAGYRGQYRTLIRNVSKEPIIIGVIRTKVRPSLYAIDSGTGERIYSERIHIGGGVLSSYIWIQPGEVAVAQTFALDFFDVKKGRLPDDATRISWWDRINLVVGHDYELFAELRMPQTLSRTKDGRWLPAKNLWRGKLTTGPIKIEFVDKEKKPVTKEFGKTFLDDSRKRNRIIDFNGKGIPNANIEITEYSYKDNYKTFATTKSDADGYFTYPAKTPERQNFFIRVSADGFFAERWIGNHSVHIKREGRMVPDILKLGRSVSVSGRVIGPDRKPLAGIPLSVDYKNDRVASINARRIVTDKNGEFKVNDLPPGKIFVRYERRRKREDPMPRPASFGIAYAEAKDGEVIDNMNLDFSKKLATIRGKVLDRDGKPRKNVDVVARWADVLVNLDHTVRSKTDANGNYEFKGLQPGTYLLGGGRSFPSGSSRPQVVMAGQILETNIESFIRGAKPPAGRKVKLNWSKGELQYALQLDPAKKSYQLRDRIKLKLLVRNSTESAKDFQHTFAFNRVHIGNDKGFYRTLDFRHFTGIPLSENFKLDPGHEITLGEFDFQITHPKDTGSANAMFGVQLKPDKYKIAMSIGNGFDSVRLEKFPSDTDLLGGRIFYTFRTEISVVKSPAGAGIDGLPATGKK